MAKVIRKDSLSFERAALLQFADDATSKMNGGIVSNHDILERFNAFEAKLTVTKFLQVRTSRTFRVLSTTTTP